jgi:hypothetical protein
MEKVMTWFQSEVKKKSVSQSIGDVNSARLGGSGGCSPRS